MAMKWIPLNGKKEPPAQQKMLILFKDNSWTEAYLKRIEFYDAGKAYVFTGDETEYDTATHYMIIDLPKNNQ